MSSTISKTITIKGKLTDSTGIPIISSTVTLVVDENWTNSFSTVTDLDGNYVLKVHHASVDHKRLMVNFAYQHKSVAVFIANTEKDEIIVNATMHLGCITTGAIVVIPPNTEPFLQPKGIHRKVYLTR